MVITSHERSICHLDSLKLSVPNDIRAVISAASSVKCTCSTNNNNPREKGIPSSITWRHGGNKVFVEGSWDNWTSRKLLRRSGHVRAILLVLPSGIYHYRIIVDGVPTFDFELPYVTDEIGQVANILDVNDNDLDNLESLAEFDAPPSPEHSYGQHFPADDEFYKEPPALPPQLPMSIPAGDEHAPMLKPKHVVIDHMFMEEGWKSQSVCALAVTHRFGPKYVNFTLYKPRQRRGDRRHGCWKQWRLS